MDLAAEIRAERARRDWTQAELAAAAGVSRSAVATTEAGRMGAAAVAIAKTLGLLRPRGQV